MSSVHLLQSELPDLREPWGASDYRSYVRRRLEPLLPDGTADLLVLPPHLGTLATLALLEPKPASIQDLLRRAGEVQRAAEELWVEEASRIGTGSRTVIAGTRYAAEGGEVYCEALVLEEGRTVGVRRQTHRYGSEKEWQLARGGLLEPIDTRAGRLGLLVGSDVVYPEPARILALQGTALLVALPATPPPYPERLQLPRMWSHVQSNQVVGVESGTRGSLLDMETEGRSAAITLCDLSGDGSGYAGRIDGAGGIRFEYDTAAVERVRTQYPILDLANRKLYQRELEALIKAGR